LHVGPNHVRLLVEHVNTLELNCRPTSPTQPSIPPGSVMNSNPRKSGLRMKTAEGVVRGVVYRQCH